MVTEWSSLSSILNTFVCQHVPTDVRILSRKWSSFSARQQFWQFLSCQNINSRASKSLALVSVLW